jgi:hypothetical protein
MYLSEDMFSEVKSAFEQADKIVNSCKGDIQRLKNLMENLGQKHDVIDAYFMRLKESNGLDWDEFLGSYYSISNPGLLEKFLKNVLHIEIFKTDYKFEELAETSEIKDMLLKKRGRQVRKAIREAYSPEREEDRQYKLRENEAKQIELLYKLRKENNGNYWFVTYDRFVYDVSIDIYKNHNNDSKYFPRFMKPNKWLEILRISDKNSLEEPVFYDILMGSAFHHAVNNIEAAVITEMLKNNIDTMVHDNEVLNIMFKEAVGKAVVADIKNEVQSHKLPNIQPENFEDSIRNVLCQRLSKYDETFREQNEELKQAKSSAAKEHRRANYFKAQLTRTIKRKK